MMRSVTPPPGEGLARRSPANELRGLGRYLGLVLLGLVLGGLAWDAVLHGRDPELAHREGLFTLSNPGHLLLILGIVTLAGGTVGAAWTWVGVTLNPRRSRLARRALVFATILATSVSLVTLRWAASVEAAAHAHEAGHVHEHGAGEAGSHEHPSAPCQPTPAQREAASRLVADTKRGLARFADLRDALAAGYVPHHHGREAIKHYFNPAYVTDGRVLDPTRPEGLMYAFTDRGPVLVAAVYLMNQAGEPGRAVGGCLTQWHTHDNLCSTDPGKGTITGLHTPGGPCPPGQVPWAVGGQRDEPLPRQRIYGYRLNARGPWTLPTVGDGIFGAMQPRERGGNDVRDGTALRGRH